MQRNEILEFIRLDVVYLQRAARWVIGLWVPGCAVVFVDEWAHLF